MSDKVTFGGEDGSLSIERVSEGDADGDTTEVLVVFESREFTAKVRTRLSPSELSLFADELAAVAATLSGTAELVGTDGVLGLRYELASGSGALEGTVQWPFAEPTIRTEFRLRTDQTFVGKTSEELSRFLGVAR